MTVADTQQPPWRRTLLLIGGTDSAGQAGLSSDLRAAAAVGLHGAVAVTAITAQGAKGVSAISPCPAPTFRAQLAAAFEDMAPSAIKTGMLATAEHIHLLIEQLDRRNSPIPLVVDTVLAASSGTRLLEAAALDLLRSQLIPRARLITPNLPEAAELLGQSLASVQKSIESTARALLALGAPAVLLKGGHGLGETVRDVLATPDGTHLFERPRLAVQARGTGCFLATAIAGNLALGKSPELACRLAGELIQRAIMGAYKAPGQSAATLHLPSASLALESRDVDQAQKSS